MKTIGFLISKKENEKRRALIPNGLVNVRNISYLYFEKGYGEILGYSDEDYYKMGVNIVNRERIFKQDIICNIHAPEPVEQTLFYKGKIFFGFIDAVQGRKITDFFLDMKMTAISWGKMVDNGRPVLWRNNEIAGEAGVFHAFSYYGRLPYECSIAVIGKGNAGSAAIKLLEKMGAGVTIYDRKTVLSLRNELGKYDIIVNTVLWDVFRKDRLIYRRDLKEMKKGAMIIDISSNKELEIETSHPTTIDNPVYSVDGILHYVVDHTPTIFWKTATESISKEIIKYIDDLVEENDNKVLKNATIIKDGKILDEKIIKFQKR
ncbi:N(5)-(carboxyethyl)ornithine synthase [subsurface metagenome]